MYVCGMSCMNVYDMYTVCVHLCMYGGVCVVMVHVMYMFVVRMCVVHHV